MVVPSVNGLTCLRDCLAALHAQRGGFQLEILVPERCGAAVQNAMAGRFPQVRVLPVPPSTGIPTMRRMGFDRATAPSVAVVEDHVIVPPDWASALLEARSDGHAVVGGSVVNGATDTRVDRLAFLCEYGHLLAPIRRGTCSSVTGNNVVYDREVLERFRKVVAEDRWEGHLHDAMRDAGIELRCRPEIRVSHRMHYPRARDYAAQRFLFSRSYAGMWAASRGMGRPPPPSPGLAPVARGPSGAHCPEGLDPSGAAPRCARGPSPARVLRRRLGLR